MFSRPNRQVRSCSAVLPALLAAVSIFLTLSFTLPAQAMNIQKVVSPKGIVGWLVEDHTLPLIAMKFGFRGGNAQDPAGKAGLAYFVSGMLDEGAGDIKSEAFQEKLQSLAIDMSFDASRDVMTGGIRTLTKNRDEAFRLLRLALTKPRMDEEPVERVREQILSIIEIDNENPENVAAEAWFHNVFAGHPYGKPAKGTPDTIKAITADDLKGYVKRNFARDNLYVTAVGDITADQFAKALDEVFGALPEKSELKTIPEAKWDLSQRRYVLPMAIPQTVVNFGQPGPKRKDKDFIPAYLLNYIVGGGGFSSILTDEVREKRGLAYSVYSYLYPFDHTGIFFGGVATQNSHVAESIDVIKKVLARVAENGPTTEELEDAKRYLTGSYALRFSSSVNIADMLLWIQIEHLGIDYVQKRNSLIEAVTLEDVKRVAKLINPDELVMTIVGQPEGLKPVGDTKAGTPAPLPRG